MPPTLLDPRQFLKDELEARRARNPDYSLRAFARHLDVSAAQLSQVLSGKRRLHAKQMVKFANKLCLSPVQKGELLMSLQNEWNSENTAGAGAGDSEFRKLKDDEFRMIADWYHCAILSLAKLPKSESGPKWIASRLGITEAQAADAVDRLVRLGFLARRGAKLAVVDRPPSIISDVPSLAIQRYHRQNLNRAIDALEQVVVDKRDFSTITLAFNSKKMSAARERIKEFRRAFAREFEHGVLDGVMTLAIQLFPVVPKKEESSR